MDRTWGREGPTLCRMIQKEHHPTSRRRNSDSMLAAWDSPTLPFPPSGAATARPSEPLQGAATKGMVLPAPASPPFGNACCWAAGQRLWAASGWREATASWRAGRSPPLAGLPSLYVGPQGKARATEAQCLPGLHSGCPPYLTRGPEAQCLGLNDTRCVKHLRGITSNSNTHRLTSPCRIGSRETPFQDPL